MRQTNNLTPTSYILPHTGINQEDMELTDVNYKLPAIPQHWRGRVQLICDICYKHFNSKRNRRRHREAIHEGRKHVCEVCDKSSRETRRQRKKYACKFCDKRFSQSGHLHRHIKNRAPRRERT